MSTTTWRWAGREMKNNKTEDYFILLCFMLRAIMRERLLLRQGCVCSSDKGIREVVLVSFVFKFVYKNHRLESPLDFCRSIIFASSIAAH